MLKADKLCNVVQHIYLVRKIQKKRVADKAISLQFKFEGIECKPKTFNDGNFTCCLITFLI